MYSWGVETHIVRECIIQNFTGDPHCHLDQTFFDEEDMPTQTVKALTLYKQFKLP